MNPTTKEIIISLLPVIILNGAAILSWIIFAFIYPGRERNPMVVERSHPSFLGSFLREWSVWIIRPFILGCKAMGLTPNMITAISLVLGFLSAYYFFIGHFATAGWILVASGALDMIDGGLARMTNQVSKEGAFFDSCSDRYSESAILTGIAFYFAMRRDITVFGDNTWLWLILLSILAMTGSQIVSYAKARGEAVGFSTNMGLMQRAERIAVLAIASAFYPFFRIILTANGMNEHWPLIIALILMAVLTNYTAVTRIVIIFRAIRRSHANNA